MNLPEVSYETSSCARSPDYANYVYRLLMSRWLAVYMIRLLILSLLFRFVFSFVQRLVLYEDYIANST